MNDLDNRPPAGSPERKKLSRIAELALDIVDLDPKNPSDQKKIKCTFRKEPRNSGGIKKFNSKQIKPPSRRGDQLISLRNLSPLQPIFFPSKTPSKFQNSWHNIRTVWTTLTAQSRLLLRFYRFRDV